MEADHPRTRIDPTVNASNTGWEEDMDVKLGHLVIGVRSLEAAVPFYCRVFGLRKRRERRSTEVRGKPMAFLTFGDQDHDIALLELGSSAQPHDETRAGLQHIAFRVGGGIEQLRAFKKRLDALGIGPCRMREHRVSWSLYFRDPDGIELEAYVDSAAPVFDADGKLEGINRPFQLD